MSKIKIEGGHKLTGEIEISGAKNSAVALVPAAILCDEEVTISNVPNISDIDSLEEILNYLNAVIKATTVLNKLKEENKLGNIKYYIIGDGTEYDNLKKLISDKGLNDNIFMLGNKENPYPYFKAADLFVMSSFHESYGLVIVEALILGIPVLSTKIATIYDILDEKYGLIVDNSFDGLYNGIRKIIDENLIPGWKKNLKDYECDNKK